MIDHGRFAVKGEQLRTRELFSNYHLGVAIESHDVYAERCQLSGKCEEVGPAKILLDKSSPSAKHISGKYDVKLNEQHLAGIFHLKYHKEKELWTCE